MNLLQLQYDSPIRSGTVRTRTRMRAVSIIEKTFAEELILIENTG